MFTQTRQVFASRLYKHDAHLRHLPRRYGLFPLLHSGQSTLQLFAETVFRHLASGVGEVRPPGFPLARVGENDRIDLLVNIATRNAKRPFVGATLALEVDDGAIEPVRPRVPDTSSMKSSDESFLRL